MQCVAVPAIEGESVTSQPKRPVLRSEQRAAAANAAFDAYDFTAEVESADEWMAGPDGAELVRAVYLAIPEREASLRASFVVVFEDESSCDVAEAYALSEFGNMFGRPRPPEAFLVPASASAAHAGWLEPEA